MQCMLFPMQQSSVYEMLSAVASLQLLVLILLSMLVCVHRLILFFVLMDFCADVVTWDSKILQCREMIFFPVFTARCSSVHSAVLRSHVVCLSVRLSVCNVGEL